MIPSVATHKSYCAHQSDLLTQVSVAQDEKRKSKVEKAPQQTAEEVRKRKAGSSSWRRSKPPKSARHRRGLHLPWTNRR
jgi:hypothetical protein